MENYAIKLLQDALDKEFIYHSQALAFVNGLSHGAKSGYLNQTEQAFRTSLDIADKRIPQLQNAIDKLNKQD